MAKKNIVLPLPTEELVQQYLNKWKDMPNYVAQEEALDKLFLHDYKGNTDINEILIKVAALNDFYSTNIFSIYDVAKHIVEINNVDGRLESGDPSLVAEIANLSIRGKKYKFYSFATKYCSHHNPAMFPIYDQYVDKVLTWYSKNNDSGFITANELTKFEEFKRTIESFQKFFRLTCFSLKEMDRFLWLLGKEQWFEKKSIFDYATKELSQDAFLATVLSGYESNDDNEHDVSCQFIKFILDEQDIQAINSVDVSKQKGHIDVMAEIEFTKHNGESAKVALFIEDKTSSPEHDNQLKTYNKFIDIKYKDSEWLTKKVFYKTGVITPQERKRVEEADWKIKSFEEIYDFWKDFEYGDQKTIISQYCSAIQRRYEESNNLSELEKCNRETWISYFSKLIKDQRLPENVSFEIENRQGNYVYLKVFPTTGSSKTDPILEIDGLGEHNHNHVIAKIRDESEDLVIKDEYKNYLKKHAKTSFEVRGYKRTLAKKILNEFPSVENIQLLDEWIINAVIEYKRIIDNKQ